MGIYLNPGNAGFQRALNSKIYVDKSELIAYTNDVLDTNSAFLCVSRPRRFGKSMAANMLCAYYCKECDSKEMFQNLKIAAHSSFAKHLNQYDVIFLNIQQFLSDAGSPDALVPYLQKTVLAELREIYGSWISPDEEKLPAALASVFAKDTRENKGFLFIIDEWDCLFRESKKEQEAQRLYLDFLKNLLKDRSYVKLAYMTGILPIKKYGTHSALNIFREFSMTRPEELAEFVGFTETEVRALCRQYGKSFEETRRWYDGYIFDRSFHNLEPSADFIGECGAEEGSTYGASVYTGSIYRNYISGDKPYISSIREDNPYHSYIHIYNPKSVAEAMQSRRFDSFWVNTETYEALKMYIDLNLDGLRDAIIGMLGGTTCRVDVESFQNDMTTFQSRDDVMSLLVHLGYLAYDSLREEVFIPNEEVRGEFYRSIRNSHNWQPVSDALESSEALLHATLSMDCEAVAAGLDKVHTDSTSVLSYNNENSLSCVITLAYFSARRDYTLIREFPSGKGFADMVFLPRKHSALPAILVELKWNHSAEGAIAQIQNRQYVRSLQDYEGNMLLVGINYDKNTKKHQCIIEQHTKQ